MSGEDNVIYLLPDIEEEPAEEDDHREPPDLSRGPWLPDLWQDGE